MKDIIKEYLIGNIAFWVCLGISVSLIVLGAVVPPIGEIHPSILTAVGELFGFATLAVVADAIRRGVDAKIKKGDLEVTLNNDGK